MIRKIPAGSAKCSKASRETTMSASSFVEDTKRQVFWTPYRAPSVLPLGEGLHGYQYRSPALGPSSSHLYGFSAFATAEVDDNFPCNLGEEFIPH